MRFIVTIVMIEYLNGGIVGVLTENSDILSFDLDG